MSRRAGHQPDRNRAIATTSNRLIPRKTRDGMTVSGGVGEDRTTIEDGKVLGCGFVMGAIFAMIWKI